MRSKDFEGEVSGSSELTSGALKRCVRRAIALPPAQQVVENASSTAPLFRSFWMGGFESACHINSQGRRLDLIDATQHDRFADADYKLLRSIGMRTGRDGIRWHRVEQSPGRYDFSSLQPLVDAAHRNGVQVIWNLCHYGWPNDLNLFSPQFAPRFARYAKAAARFIKDRTDQPLFFAPVNEISYFSWAIATGGYMYPYAVGRGWDVKRQLVRAAIEACEAIWEVDRGARFLQPDPVIHIVPPRDRPDLAQAAAGERESQYHAWDMLIGRIDPELGGHARYLDILGVNYYHSNQFEHQGERLRWEDAPRDERFVPFSDLLVEVHQRYGRPLIVSETSHFGCGRAAWLRETAGEVKNACEQNIPVHGVCLYPILDRPDWEDPSHWHNSGMWDLVCDGDDACLRRVLHEAYAQELSRAQAMFAANETP